MFKNYLAYKVLFAFALSLIFHFLPAQTQVSNLKPVAQLVLEAEKKAQPLIISNLFGANQEAINTRSFGTELTAFDIVTLDSKILNQVYQERPEFIELNVPYQNETITLKMVKVDITAEGFYVTQSNTKEPFPYQEGAYYRGVIGQDFGSTVAISIFKDEIYGMFTSAELGNVAFNRLDQSNDYLLYSDRNMETINPASCAAEEPEGYAEEVAEALAQPVNRDVRCVKVYIECDYELQVNKGGTANTVNYISAVFNNIATLYQNEQIVTQISQVYVWTTPDNYSTTSSVTALNQFRNARPNFNGDIAHLAALGGNNLGGVAWLDVLCTTYDYAFSNIHANYNNVPVYSWTVEVMTHEMGHNLGSPHTQSCSWPGGALDNCYPTEGGCPPGPPPTNGGTIMSYCHLTSYGINFNNGFGSLPGDLIRSRVGSASCLGLCSDGNSCQAPNAPIVSNITTNSALVSWGAVTGTIGYIVQYRVLNTSWITLAQQTSTSINLNGLVAGTTYEVHVQSVCSSGNSSWSTTTVFTTTGGSSCNTPTGLTVSNITSSSAIARWTAVSGALSYNLQYKQNSSSTWSNFNTSATTITFGGLAANTTYNLRVQTVCSGGNSNFSPIVNFTTTGGSRYYCTSSGNNSNNLWIDLVTLGTINNVTGSNGGYGDFTSLSTNLIKGRNASMNLSAGKTNAQDRLYFRVYIDFNGDGDFNDSGETVASFNSTSSGVINRLFTVPSNAATGATRMRVSVRYGGYPSSCGTFSNGEVEDYTVIIVNALKGQQAIVEKEQFEVSPNPVSDFLSIDLNAVSSKQASLVLYDANGKQVMAESWNITEGNNQKTIDLSQLPAGLYVVGCQSNEGTIVKKIIKL